MKVLSTTCGDAEVTVIAVQRRVVFIQQRAGATAVCHFDAAVHVRDACFISCAPSDGGSVLVHVAIACDDKTVLVVACSFPSGPSAASTRQEYTTKLPKKITCMIPGALPTGERIVVVGDKYGDVLALPTPDVSSRRRTLATHTASTITCMGMTPGYDLLVTGDRDEKIRASRFPHSWDIQAMCLAHLRFTSCLHVLRAGVGTSTGGEEASPSALRVGHAYAAGELMLSGGGDGTLRLWHVRSGTLLHSVYLNPTPGVEFPGVHLASDGRLYRGDVPAKRARLDGAAASVHTVPTGATDVWEGRLGSYTSAGAHADADMNEMRGEEEADAPAPAAAAEEVPPVQEAEEERDEEAAAAAVGEIAPAYGRHVFPRLEGLPVIPCAIVEHDSGLVLSHVESEDGFRLFTVGMDEEPSNIRVQRGHVDEVGEVIPQARVRQVGAVHTPHTPLAACVKSGSSSGGPTFLIGMLARDTGVFTVEAYTCVTDAETGAVRGVRAGGDASPASWLQSVLGVDAHAALMDMKACNGGEEVDVARVRACIMAEALIEYDKSIVMTSHRKREAEQEPAAAAAATMADDAMTGRGAAVSTE